MRESIQDALQRGRFKGTSKERVHDLVRRWAILDNDPMVTTPLHSYAHHDWSQEDRATMYCLVCGLSRLEFDEAAIQMTTYDDLPKCPGRQLKNHALIDALLARR